MDITANMLVAVPGGSDGPGGVLVLGENFVVWKNQGHQEVRAALPRRKILGEERSVLIVSATAHKHKVPYSCPIPVVWCSANCSDYSDWVL